VLACFVLASNNRVQVKTSNLKKGLQGHFKDTDNMLLTCCGQSKLAWQTLGLAQRRLLLLLAPAAVAAALVYAVDRTGQ
jgi:hypothetical protein